VGPFIGAVSSFAFGPAFGGYDSSSNVRLRSDFEIGARLGIGLEGLLTSSMDGQIWTQVLFAVDPAQLDLGCSTCDGGRRTNQAVPRVPGRTALRLGLRMPYYVIPFDLILLAPALYLVAPSALQSVVFTSAFGGLLTLQRRWSTGIGTFQFMAGREVGLTLWGYGKPNQFIATPTEGPAQLVNYQSVELDVPVLEYTPPRAFATTLALAAQIQMGFDVEFTNNATYASSGSPYSGGLGTSWYVYLRVRLDARKYFGGSSD
jgi:hypothetical protein